MMDFLATLLLGQLEETREANRELVLSWRGCRHHPEGCPAAAAEASQGP